MQVIRQFSVYVIDSKYHDIFKPNYSYEVLAVDFCQDDGITWFLVVSENRDFVCLESAKCRLALLHDR